MSPVVYSANWCLKAGRSHDYIRIDGNENSWLAISRYWMQYNKTLQVIVFDESGFDDVVATNLGPGKSRDIPTVII